MSSAMRQKHKRHITNKEVAHMLRTIAAAHLIKNKSRFRIIAYENAADTVEHLTREVYDIWQEGKLSDVSGIGEIMSDALDEYFRKGYSRHFREIVKGIPDTVFELMKIPSIGPKKAYKLVNALKLNNVDTLFSDIKKEGVKGTIAKIPTFGKKSQELILTAIERYEGRTEESHQRMPLPYADRLAKEIVEYLQKNKDIGRIDVLGSLRRRVTTIGDIDIAVTCKDKVTSSVIDYFTKYPKKVSVDNAGGKKASIIVYPHRRVDLRVQSEKTYGSMLQYFTGSKEHNVKLREFALKRNLSLSEYGIKDLKKNKLYTFSKEEDFYDFLRLQYIPPEIRESGPEIEIAQKRALPRLVKLKDMKGDFHTHSNYPLKPSHDEGNNNYEELTRKAESLGYAYIGFSDHNPRQSDTIEEEIISTLKKRKEHILKKFSKSKVHCYIGLETDILPSGKIALPEKAFPYVDYLIISVHSVFGLSIEAMTKRVLKALEFPKVKILGHPTGRLLMRREGYELYWKQVFEACKKKNIALEINSWPERLDLPDSLVYEAKLLGCSFFVNSDAHDISHMDNMLYGVSVAKRGWLTKNDIINTKPNDFVRKWFS